MTFPRTHDRILLTSVIAVAAGVLILRGFEGIWSTAGLVLLIGGGIGLVAGMAFKIRAGR